MKEFITHPATGAIAGFAIVGLSIEVGSFFVFCLGFGILIATVASCCGRID